MVEKMKDESQEKGFVIRDKRFSAKKEEEGESQPKEGATKEEPPKVDASKADASLPEISFSSLIFSLSTSALIQLGEIQDPISQQLDKNLPLAKQTIDLIGMLKEKTKGNLTSEEQMLLENILYDLRMRYVRTAG